MENKKQARWRRLIRSACHFMRGVDWRRGGLIRYKPNVVDPDPIANPECIESCCATAAMVIRGLDSFECEGSYYQGTTGNKVYDKAVREINNFYGVRYLFDVNDGSSSKEEVIQKLLAVANS